MQRSTSVTLGLALGILAGAGAASAASYTSAYFFGDSLSDPGNLYALTGQPGAPYWQGRRSNGPVWAEHVAARFSDRHLATANYAYAGATAVRNDDTAAGLRFQIPDLPDQLASFGQSDRSDAGKRPVGMLWFGANDILGAIGSQAPTAETVAAAATSAAGAVVDGIATLRSYGVRDVVVLNLPSLDQTPLFATSMAAPLAELGSELFNDTLDALVAGSRGRKRITVIDMEATFDDLIANPEKYGVKDARTPCVIPGVSVCSSTEADERAFFDLLHPNRIVHGQIAGLVNDKAAPVPLPAGAALLLAGLAALALAARRRRAA